MDACSAHGVRTATNNVHTQSPTNNATRRSDTPYAQLQLHVVLKADNLRRGGGYVEHRRTQANVQQYVRTHSACLVFNTHYACVVVAAGATYPPDKGVNTLLLTHCRLESHMTVI